TRQEPGLVDFTVDGDMIHDQMVDHQPRIGSQPYQTGGQRSYHVDLLSLVHRQLPELPVASGAVVDGVEVLDAQQLPSTVSIQEHQEVLLQLTGLTPAPIDGPEDAHLRIDGQLVLPASQA